MHLITIYQTAIEQAEIETFYHTFFTFGVRQHN